MSAIFISHSNKDKAVAAETRERLHAQSHQSVFLDFHPEDGIPAGRNWEKELYAKIRGCRAMIILCSEHSMNSQWCFAEIAYARALGKPVFPLKLEACRVTEILTDPQIIDMTAGAEEGWTRLWSGLTRAGLDPKSAFEWDGQRPPFPGLSAFEEKDAAVLFGREGEIQGVIELFNQSCLLPDPRLFVLRGASGIGKSSLMRAGLLPRLRRDSERWVVLDPFRPADVGGPFAGLARVLAKTLGGLGRGRDWKDIRSLLEGCARTRTNEPLAELALDLRTQSENVLVVIDQFEELLTNDLAGTAPGFLDLIGCLATVCGSPFFLVTTLRSDFLAEFEHRIEIQNLPYREIPIRPLGVERLAQAIERPCQIAGIELESGLVQAMVEEADGIAGLPFLAFVLRKLWDRRGEARSFSLQAYAELGGLAGAITESAEKIYRDAQNSEQGERTLRSAFLSMVVIGDEGQITRRQTKLLQLSHDVQGILERFVRARLLVKSSDENGEPIIEIAHEALLTGWRRLENWITPVRDELHLLRHLRLAAAQWEQHGRAEEFLWPEKRLTAVFEMLDRLRPHLNDAERLFVGLVNSGELLEELPHPGTSHHRRAYIGDCLARNGEPRPGVGVGADGLPEIAWCDVPGGEVILKRSATAVSVVPFQVSKYPITWGQYSVFLKAADGYRNAAWWDRLAVRDESPAAQRMLISNHPAEVSWYDAVAFCRWLSSALSDEIRLPTEWEWQQAATGGNPANTYPWGAEWDARRANTVESKLGRTTAVGVYPLGASAVGVLDLSGNVWEWCLNQFENPFCLELTGTAPRAVRGGSWNWPGSSAVTTLDERDSPELRTPDHGFRVVRSSLAGRAQ